MILGLPDGYDFQVSGRRGGPVGRAAPSASRLHARSTAAPVVVVMDEPDSNLDAEGTMALARAVEDHKKRGGAAIIVAHRHGAFAQCDTVYLMEGGRPMPATAGRAAAPVRSLQGADGTKPRSSPPAAAPTPAGRGRVPRAVEAGKAIPGSPSRAGAQGRGRVGDGPEGEAGKVRPMVRIVRGGRKDAVTSPPEKSRAPTGAETGERTEAGPAPSAASAGADFASARRRRIARAIVRVNGARAAASGDGGERAAEPVGHARVPDPRTNRDDAS